MALAIFLLVLFFESQPTSSQIARDLKRAINLRECGEHIHSKSVNIEIITSDIAVLTFSF